MPLTELPEDPVDRIEMHRAMLSHVQKIDQEILQHSVTVDRELETVAQTRPGSLDHRKLVRRLKERIELLNTLIGNSMDASTAAG